MGDWDGKQATIDILRVHLKNKNNKIAALLKGNKSLADEIIRLADENKQLKEYIDHLQSCLDLEKVSDINE